MNDEKIKNITVSNIEINNLINEVTTQTVVKLKKSGLMSESNKSAFKKTEELLKNYNKYLIAINSDPKNTTKTQILIKIIDEALITIQDDAYADIINMFYFEHKTRAEIAEFYDVDDKTITRNKKRLINDLKIILFSDTTIEEIFL